MRLLHAETLEFESFDDSKLPNYVILSHTWGRDELSFQDMCWVQRLRTIPKELLDNPLVPLLLNVASPAQATTSENDLVKRAGYQKILKTAETVLHLGHTYFWIDTVCINKESSSELQEAINSMYNWYKKSILCIVYLSDVHHQPLAGVPLSHNSALFTSVYDAFSASRWIQRG